MNLYFKDRTFSFELLRAAAFAPYGGSDIGECLATAARIREGDFESWHREWEATATRVEAEARDALARGHRVSARRGLLRASTYHRTAEFFLHGNPADPRILTTARASAGCFADAAALMDVPPLAVRVPYEGTTLPAHFWRPNDSDAPKPTLIFTGGFDSVLEEMYFEGAAAGIERGWNVLAFDGPGQGMPLREGGLVFRPDWEAVVTPMVDFALSRPDVDPSRLALLGMSQGGYLAPRAAAFEPRVRALVAFDGVFCLLDTALAALKAQGRARAWVMRAIEADEAPLLDAILAVGRRRTTGTRWMVENGMWTFGAKSPREVLRLTVPYTMEGIAERIRCPTLVCDAEDDQFFAGQPQRLHDALTCDKTLMRFTAAEGAGEHCQEGALTLFHARAFDWLEDTFKRAAADATPTRPTPRPAPRATAA